MRVLLFFISNWQQNQCFFFYYFSNDFTFHLNEKTTYTYLGDNQRKNISQRTQLNLWHVFFCLGIFAFLKLKKKRNVIVFSRSEKIKMGKTEKSITVFGLFYSWPSSCCALNNAFKNVFISNKTDCPMSWWIDGYCLALWIPARWNISLHF